jgi:hypothetical protein
MKQLTAFITLLHLLIALSASDHVIAGVYTYDFVDYPDLQNGYTLTGQITTTVNSGLLTPNEISSWRISLSNGFFSNGFTLSSTDFGATVQFQGVFVSPGRIDIPVPTDFGDLIFGQNGAEFLSYERVNHDFGAGPVTSDFYRGLDGRAWNVGAASNTLVLTSSDPWVVAAAIAIAVVHVDSGELTVKLDSGGTVTLPAGTFQSLAAGDTLITSSSGTATVTFDGGTQMRLTASTTFQLAPSPSSSIVGKLYDGLIHVIDRIHHPRDYSTSNAVIGVRGTEFSMGFQEANGLDSTTVDVQSGIVDVTGIRGEFDELTAGESVTISDPIPEPSSMLLLLAGVAGIGVLLRAQRVVNHRGCR